MLSVVVPAWREALMLRKTLPRALELPGVDEVVVAVPAQDSETAEVALALGARVVPAHLGRGSQLNAGAHAARGDLLVFLHADSWLDRDAALEARAALQDPTTSAAVFRQHVEASGIAYRCLERVADLRSRLLGATYGDSGLCLRRETFQRIGGYGNGALFEDLEIGQRLRAEGRIVLLQSRLHQSPRRWQDRGVVRTTLENWRLRFAWRMGTPPADLHRAYYGPEFGNSFGSVGTSASGSAPPRASTEGGAVAVERPAAKVGGTSRDHSRG